MNRPIASHESSARAWTPSPAHKPRLAWTCLLWLLLVVPCCRSVGSETNNWQAALASMPLPAGTRELDRTNCIPLMLEAFRSNGVVKAIVFLPGGTDEFYHFRRARAVLTNAEPTLADAVTALSAQTLIRATFKPPMLLLHTWEDPTTPDVKVLHEATARKLRLTPFLEHAVFNDRAWGVIQPQLEKRLNVFVKPILGTQESWHFYRHSFAGWNLSGWEALEAISLAGMTSVTVNRKQILFTGDTRPRWNRDMKPAGSATDPR